MDSKSERHLERWLVPVLIILISGVAFLITTTFDTMPPILKRGIQPSDFPQLVASIIIALTLLMMWRDPVRADGTMERVTWWTFALLGLFVALTAIDFFIALAVFAVGLARLWGEKRIPLLAFVGLAVPVVIFFLFDLVFEVRFPRGLLTSLWYG